MIVVGNHTSYDISLVYSNILFVVVQMISVFNRSERDGNIDYFMNN